MPKKFEPSSPESQPEEPQPPQQESKRDPLEWKVLREMRELADAELPKAEEDWDLIWVLSGSPIDIAIESTKKSRNESRERLETGLKIAREVTAVRLKKDPKDVTAEDILSSGPDVFWNAKDWANDNLRQRAEEGLLEKRYNFPRQKIIISPNLGIEHTSHQFERFPEELEEKSRKVVIVSDTYHLPRVKRTSKKYDAIPPGKIIWYPSESKKLPRFRQARAEIKKIPQYVRGGILPKEERK